MFLLNRNLWIDRLFLSPFSSLKMFSHCLLASIVSEEKSVIICIVSTLYVLGYLDMKLFFKIFLFVFGIHQFVHDMLRCGVLCPCLAWVFLASCICKCMSSTKLKEISLIISSNTFYSPFPPLSSPGIPGTHMLDLWHCPQVIATQTFSNIFLLLLKLYNFCWSPFKFTDSFLHYLQSSVKLIRNFFLLDIFSRSHISVYKYFPFLSWNFLFSCIMRIIFFMFLSMAIIDFLLFPTSSSFGGQFYWLPFHFGMGYVFLCFQMSTNSGLYHGYCEWYLVDSEFCFSKNYLFVSASS